MCEYCKNIRNSRNLKCNIFCYTEHWKYIDDELQKRTTESQILGNAPVNYCPMCGRKLGD